MIYLLKNKPKKSNFRKLFLVFGLFLFFVLIGFTSPAFLRSVGISTAIPVWKVGGMLASPFTSIGDYFSTKNTLVNDKLALEEEVASLRLKVIDYDLVSKENEELKLLLGRGSSSMQILAKILSKPPRSPYDTMVVDVGSSQGVVLGSRVFLSDNVIIGIVKNVTPRTSLVEMFSTGDRTQEAVLSRTGESFILNGSGGANFKIEVPKDADVMWGDMFMYPGLSSYALGSVYYIDVNSQSSFKTVYVRIPGNVWSTKYLFVETDK